MDEQGVLRDQIFVELELESQSELGDGFRLVGSKTFEFSIVTPVEAFVEN